MSLILDGSNGLSDVDGTAATPAIRGTDTNTGIFFPAADTIAFSEGGTEVARFDSAGNLGVGTASPSSFFSEARNLVVGSGSGGQGMTIFAGTASQSRLMFADGTSGDAAYTGFVQYDHSSNALTFGTNGGNERMRIDSSGSLLVNTTSLRNSGRLSIDYSGSVAGGMGINDTASANASAFIGFLTGGTFRGSITNNNNTAVAYNTTSDYRLKENIAPMTGALATVAQLKPCTYVWKETGGAGQGFIAHELAEVCPDAVTGEKDAFDKEGNPKYQGVDTSFLVATLTAAIQELKATVDAQAARIAALENPPVESVTNE